MKKLYWINKNTVFNPKKQTLIEWFQSIVEVTGLHPRLIINNKEIVKKANIPNINEDQIKEIVKATIPACRKYIEKHNKYYKQGKAHGYIEMKEVDWILFNPIPTHTTSQIKEEKETKKEEKPKNKKRGRPIEYFLFGHSITNILIWMGANGFTNEVAYKVINHYPKLRNIQKPIIRAALHKGRKNKCNFELLPKYEMEIHKISKGEN